MLRRALLALFAIVLAALVVACGASSSPGAATAEPTALSGRIDVRIGGLLIHAETARTVEERAQGLSGRDSLPDDGGMLFFLGEERIPGFTMREMRFPLDFIWISRDRSVADLTEGVPHPEATGETPSGIQPDVPVLYVLEVNAGIIQEFGVRVGDAVSFEPDVS